MQASFTFGGGLLGSKKPSVPGGSIFSRVVEIVGVVVVEIVGVAGVVVVDVVDAKDALISANCGISRIFANSLFFTRCTCSPCICLGSRLLKRLQMEIN